MWNFTPEESEIYLRLRLREIILRESILSIGSSSGDTSSSKTIIEPYCQACRAAAKSVGKRVPDCTNCSKDIKILMGNKG